MKVTVLGAGIIGITTAYFLKKSGHDVTIVDKQSAAASECSYANGAQLSYVAAQPWSNIGALGKGIMWLGRKDAPLKFAFRPEFDFWKWIFEFVVNCYPKYERENTKHILDVSLYSREVLHREEMAFDFNFDYQKKGKLTIFDDEKDYKAYLKQERLQEIMGGYYKVLSKDEAVALEPAIEHLTPNLKGYVLDPQEETGDAYKFCLGLEEKLKKMGVEFKYGEEIKEIVTEGSKVTKVITNNGELTSDMFVMCLGVNTKLLTKKLGVDMAVYPIKGYSLTIDTPDESKAVQSSVTVYGKRTVFTKIGKQMRVAGTAEFAGYNSSANEFRSNMMKKLTKEIFPEAGEVVSEWACLRPCTPDCRPVLGKTAYDNLVLNTGQGSLGWTMAFSSAKMVADVIDGRQTEIDIKPFEVSRFN